MNTTFFQKASENKRSISWGDIFSDVWKKHRKDQRTALLTKGMGSHIPAPNRMLSDWQKPWLFARYGSSWGGYGLDENGTPKPVFTYSLDDDGNATITGYTGNVSALVIPDEIDGHKVIALGDNAFKGKKLLEYVEIPNNVVKIGSYVFANTSLTDLKLPEKLTYLGRCVLSGNTGVTEIVIPKTLTTVGSKWENILEGDGPFHESNVQKATLEKGITSIPGNLFHKNTTLMQVIIPDTVTKIEKFAFAECGNLESVSLPGNVNQIGDYVFANTKLTELKLPRNLTHMGRCVLSGNTGVTEIVIPKTLTTVESKWENILEGDGPFHESNVQKAILEKGITSIPGNLFHKNTTLTQVIIPDTVTKIEKFAFAECGNLESVSLPGNVNQIGDYVFAKTGIKGINMPDSILEIGNYVFANTKLTELKLPRNLTHMGRCVLSGNTGVTEIVIPKTLTTVESKWENILKGMDHFMKVMQKAN